MAIDTILEGYMFEYWPRNNNLLSQQTDISFLKIYVKFNEDEYNTIVNGKRKYRIEPKTEEITGAGTEHPLGYVDQNLDEVYGTVKGLMKENGILDKVEGKVVFVRLESILQHKDGIARASKELIKDYMEKKKGLN